MTGGLTGHVDLVQEVVRLGDIGKGDTKSLLLRSSSGTLGSLVADKETSKSHRPLPYHHLTSRIDTMSSASS